MATSQAILIRAGSTDKLRIKPHRGFTLVELLVVITIIGILVSLLLPAVQSAREQGRMTECRNHVRQLALGMLAHETAMSYLPTGGWGFAWTGDPDCGTGMRQPGGWCYCILPYIDQAALRRSAGLPSGSNAKQTALQTLITTPLIFLHCPDRRPPALYPNEGQPQANVVNPPNVVKTDYAANGGDNQYVDATQVSQPGTYTQGNTPSYWATQHPQNTGVNVQHCELKMAAITDGLSNTCLIGEKNLDPDLYLTSASGGDNENAFTGLNWDCIRTSANGRQRHYLHVHAAPARHPRSG